MQYFAEQDRAANPFVIIIGWLPVNHHAFMVMRPVVMLILMIIMVVNTVVAIFAIVRMVATMSLRIVVPIDSVVLAVGELGAVVFVPIRCRRQHNADQEEANQQGRQYLLHSNAFEVWCCTCL